MTKPYVVGEIREIPEGLEEMVVQGCAWATARIEQGATAALLVNYFSAMMVNGAQAMNIGQEQFDEMLRLMSVSYREGLAAEEALSKGGSRA